MASELYKHRQKTHIMQNLKNKYIEISSEEEMQKATNWLTSLGLINPHSNPKISKETFVYLFIGIDKHFHFNDTYEKSSHWKPFSVLYEEGMPWDKEEDLLSKAKRLYPIGTQYKCAAGGYNVHTVESMNWAPSPSGSIYGEMSKGCIYKNGKWAEIVHEVKPVEKWSVGSYVVFLTDEVKTNSGAEITKGKHYCITKNDHGTLLYCKGNNLKMFNFFWEQEQCEWFPTLEEAEAFSKSLIPLTELQPPKKDHNPEYVKLVNMDYWKGGCRDLKLGTIYKWSHLTTGIIASLNSDYWDKWTREFEISTKDAYDAQQFISVSKPTDVKPPKSKFEDMSKDELLDYARKKYPTGCKARCLTGKEVETLEGDPYWKEDMIVIPQKGLTSNGTRVYKNKQWAEIIEMPKIEVPTSVYSPCHITETSYSYNGIKETHQSINKTGKQFSPIKVELIKVKQLKIN